MAARRASALRSKPPLDVDALWAIRRIGAPTIAPDGGEAVRLTNLATGVTALKWFPDGKRIAFVSWVWPDLPNEAAQAKRVTQKKEAKVKIRQSEKKKFKTKKPQDPG